MPTLHFEYIKRGNSRRCTFSRRDAIRVAEQFTNNYEEQGMIMHVDIPVRDREHAIKVRDQFMRALKVVCHPNIAKKFRYLED